MDIRGFFTKKAPAPEASQHGPLKRTAADALQSEPPPRAESDGVKRRATLNSGAVSSPQQTKGGASSSVAGCAGRAAGQVISPEDFFSMGAPSKASSSQPSVKSLNSSVATTANAPAPHGDDAKTALPTVSASASDKRCHGSNMADTCTSHSNKIKRQAQSKPSPMAAPSAARRLAEQAPPSKSLTTDTVRTDGANPAMNVEPAALSPPAPPPRKWYPGMKDDRPPNKGNKRIPTGAPGCLANRTFVITGTQDSLEREDAVALIHKYGGRVTSAVSGKTSFVLRGIDPDTGNPLESSKVQKARQLKTSIIDEDQLLEMIRVSAPQPVEDKFPASPVPVPPFKTNLPPSVPPATHSDFSEARQQTGVHSLWAEKYRPRNLNHLVGNADHIKRLTQWLNGWPENLKSEVAGASSKSKDQTMLKAALLSGPPGVGKTSAARVVLAVSGYDAVELNASDTRSQKALKSMAEDLVGNTSIAEFATGQLKCAGGCGRMALIMDEVDGMSSGDRGGMAQLIATIKSSKMPIICICNDRNSPKVRSLANHCLDLRFRRPSPAETVVAMRRVVTDEGYAVEADTLNRIAQACNSDIRQMLNLLQMWRPEGGERLSSSEVSKRVETAFKDVSVGPFDVADKFFKEPNTPLDKRLRHYFVDSGMTPLMVQDSYLSVSMNLPAMPAMQRELMGLERVAMASESIASADVVGKRISSEQQWALAPLHGILSCCAPGYYAQGNIGRINFPSWLGRNSTCLKRHRQLRECTSRMQAHVSGSKEEVRQAYVPALRELLLRPMRELGADGASKVIELMDAYCLSKDDFDAIMEMQLLIGPGAKADIATVPANVKATLTRKYNAAHQGIKRGVRSLKMATEHFAEDIEEDGEEDEEEDLIVAVKTKAATSSTAKSKTKFSRA